MQIITVSSDWTITEARYNEAKKMFIKKYGELNISKEIFMYVRTKKTQDDSIDKKFSMDNKVIDVFGTGIAVQIIVWKAGV